MSEQSGSWQPDPFGRHQYRFWDGSEWTDQVADDGVVSTDPAVAEPAPVEPAPEPEAVDPAPVEPEPEPAPVEPEAAPTEPVAAVPPAEPAPTEPVAAVPPVPPAEPAPASPPPPVYSEPAPAPSDGGGKGGKTLLIVLLVLLVIAAVAAAVWFLVIADDDDDEDLRADAVSSLRSGYGLSGSQAECVVEELDATLDLGELATAIEQDDVRPSQDRALDDALAACGVDGDVATPADTTTSTVDDSTDDTTTTTTTTVPDDDDDPFGPGLTLPPAIVAMMAEELANETGLTTDQAECLLTGMFERFADDDFESLLDPNAMDFDSMSATMEVFEECGVDPDQLDGGLG